MEGDEVRRLIAETPPLDSLEVRRLIAEAVAKALAPVIEAQNKLITEVVPSIVAAHNGLSERVDDLASIDLANALAPYLDRRTDEKIGNRVDVIYRRVEELEDQMDRLKKMLLGTR